MERDPHRPPLFSPLLRPVGVVMVQLVAMLLFLTIVVGVEWICLRREKRGKGAEYRLGMVAVRRLIDDVEHGRIIR